MSRPPLALYVTHRASTSPEEEWCSWLSTRGYEVLLLGHPFASKRPNASHLVLYREGRPVRRVALGFHLPWAPSLFFYLKDALLDLAFPLFTGFRRVDLCISADPLNTGALLPWRRLGLIRRLVHYTIDYSPRRFANPLLNSLYHFLDRRACYGADALWVLSPRMMDARRRRGVDPARCAPVTVVPMGADVSRIAVPDLAEVPRRLLYLGSLRENQGLELCAEVFAESKREFPDLTWEIVGEGPLRDPLEERLKSLGVAAGVVWHGFLPDHRDVEKVLAKGGVGLALYEPSPDTYTGVTDPGKPKVYLACGLPVLVTEVPAVAEEIRREGAGDVVPYSKGEAVAVLRDWWRNPPRLLAMRRKALALASRYNWPVLFERTLGSTFPG